MDGFEIILTEPFSSWVAVGLGGLKYEDGWMMAVPRLGAAAQLGEDLPGLQHGDGPFALAADTGVVAVDPDLSLGEWWSPVVAFERGSDGAAGALVALVGEGHHPRLGQSVEQPVGSGGVQVVHRAGQRG